MRNRDARIAGILYLVSIVAGFFALDYLPARFIVPGDAAATAHAIAANQSLFRIAVFSDPIVGVTWLAVVLALFKLLRDVDATLAQLMLVLGAFLQVPLYFVNVINYAAAGMLATKAPFLSAIPQAEREALTMLFMRLHHYELLASLTFAGLWLLPLGVLVYRSRFLPRLLGAWLAGGGIGWLAITATGFLAPQYSDTVSNVTTPLTFAEIGFALWLTALGARKIGRVGRASTTA